MIIKEKDVRRSFKFFNRGKIIKSKRLKEIEKIEQSRGINKIENREKKNFNKKFTTTIKTK